jgi:TPR repeat protein
VIRSKILPLSLLAFALGAVEVREFAFGQTQVAQNANDLRRAAFQMSKESAAAGEYADAIEALQPLADSGDALAQYSLGILYRTGGKDLPQDGAKAIAWFSKAADQGDAGAMRELAITFEKGMPGVPADAATAMRWYDKAANRGDALAQLNLGEKLANGQDLKKDPIQAYKWLTLAGRGVFYDDEDERRIETKKSRDTLVASMSPTEVSMGEKQALQFSAQ